MLWALIFFVGYIKVQNVNLLCASSLANFHKIRYLRVAQAVVQILTYQHHLGSHAFWWTSFPLWGLILLCRGRTARVQSSRWIASRCDGVGSGGAGTITTGATGLRQLWSPHCTRILSVPPTHLRYLLSLAHLYGTRRGTLAGIYLLGRPGGASRPSSMNCTHASEWLGYLRSFWSWNCRTSVQDLPLLATCRSRRCLSSHRTRRKRVWNGDASWIQETLSLCCERMSL